MIMEIVTKKEYESFLKWYSINIQSIKSKLIADGYGAEIYANGVMIARAFPSIILGFDKHFYIRKKEYLIWLKGSDM